ncbi:hypothetical protein [Lacipirellula sp.]|uniref:hypothetical protein n=1 Tax=Lacipirellula sp. TaxID=2691419 RepID=UPI003D0F0844
MTENLLTLDDMADLLGISQEEVLIAWADGDIPPPIENDGQVYWASSDFDNE